MTDALSNYLQLFGILVLFFVILYVAYLASKFVARLQSGRVSGKNMTIIEAISVGPQKTLQIIRVGKTYMVVGVSREHITYLREIDPTEIQLYEGQQTMAFGSVLEKVIGRQIGKKPMSGEEQDDHNQLQ